LQNVAKKFSKKYYKALASVIKSISKCYIKPREMRQKSSKNPIKKAKFASNVF